MTQCGLTLNFTNIHGASCNFFRICALTLDVVNERGSLELKGFVSPTCCQECKEPVETIIVAIGPTLREGTEDECVQVMPWSDFPNLTVDDAYTAIKKYKVKGKSGIFDMTQAQDYNS